MRRGYWEEEARNEACGIRWTVRAQGGEEGERLAVRRGYWEEEVRNEACGIRWTVGAQGGGGRRTGSEKGILGGRSKE